MTGGGVSMATMATTTECQRLRRARRPEQDDISVILCARDKLVGAVLAGDERAYRTLLALTASAAAALASCKAESAARAAVQEMEAGRR